MPQVYEGANHTLLHPASLAREASETGLHWHIPAFPPQMRFPHAAVMQSALQHAFAAAQATSEQHSDDSAALYTSSTGYSHSPPVSPTGKRSLRVVTALHASTAEGDGVDGALPGGRLPKLMAGTPEGADTPDHQREFPARRRAGDVVRQRAACELYGLRRLRASPRWALEAAEMSDDSRSAGQT